MAGKKKDVYMPLIIGDWLKGTRGMKAEVRGVYISLLLFQWDNGYLPVDMDELILIDPEIQKAWEKINHKFTETAPGKLQNKKLEEVRDFFAKQKNNGSLGGRPKKEKENPNNNPNINPKPNLHNGVGVEDGFVTDPEDSSLKKSEKTFLQKPIPPSLAMIEDAFTGNGLTTEQAEEFFNDVQGRTGWENIHDWKTYTGSAISKRLNKIHNGQFTSSKADRVSAQKQSVADVKRLAIEVLLQSGNSDS